MKRITFLLVVTIAAFLGITFLATRNFARIDRQDQHAGHQQAQANGVKKTPKEDGSQNPSLIPDIDAQEILFKILSAHNPNDKTEEQRKKSFLRVNGFNDAEAAAITYAAYEYKRQIEPLDIEVDKLKAQHWPNPSASVKGQLTQMQHQKEAIVADSILTPLKAQLRGYDQTGKLDKFLVNEIKKKTKGFSVDLPSKKISRLEDYLSNFFSVSAQYGGCDTGVNIYSSTWVDYDDGYVYSNNSYSAPYNNCGHTYTLSWTLDNTEWASSFSLWGVDLAGTTIQAFAQLGGYCEQAQQTFGNGNFNAGNNSSQATPEDYVTVTGLTVPANSALNNSGGSAYVDASTQYGFTAGGGTKTVKIYPGFANVSPSSINGGIFVNPNTEVERTANSGLTMRYTKTTNTTGSFNAYCTYQSGTAHVLGAESHAISFTSSNSISVSQ